MKIRLSEIPQEGRQYTFDRKSAELNGALRDLIGEGAYDVNMEIRPIGNAYELRGRVKTEMPEVCSTCGEDFNLRIDRPINEILFEDQEEYRKSHSVQGNQSVDFLSTGPTMTPYRNDVFDAGDFVHEMIAYAEPFYPMCGGDGKCRHAEQVSEILRRLEADFAKADEKPVGNPAFSVLKDLEIQKKN